MLWARILIQDFYVDKPKRKEAGYESAEPSIPKKGSHDVCGTHYTQPIPVEGVRVNLRCGDMAMTQKLLYRSNVVPAFQEMCCQTVAQTVASGVFRDSRATGRVPHGFLDDSFVEVMAALDSRLPVEVTTGGRKHELPSPLCR